MVRSATILLILINILTGYSGCSQTRGTAGVTETKASEGSFKYVAFVPGNYIKMEVDRLDNIYLLTSGYQLKKIDANGDSVAVFNDVKQYGNPNYIDASNPFKILVYYNSFSTAVFLDSKLTPRNSLNFRKKNIFSVKAITTSYDNNIWLFDEQGYNLKKIDNDGKVLLESTDLRMLTENVPSPTEIIDSENFVYLYDPSKGFYVFDYFGGYKNHLPLLNWKSPSASKNILYGFEGNSLQTYELNSAIIKKYPLPSFFKGHENIKAMNGKVYLLSSSGITAYMVQ